MIPSPYLFLGLFVLAIFGMGLCLAKAQSCAPSSRSHRWTAGTVVMALLALIDAGFLMAA